MNLAEAGFNLIKRSADAAVATAGVGAIAGFGAYEWVATKTNYYDAPMICGSLALGVPVALVGGAYVAKRGVGALAGLDLAQLRAAVYGSGEEAETAVSADNWLSVTHGIERARLPVYPIGQDVATGGVVTVDFAETPHLLVNGQTGSGKTMSVLRPLAAMVAVSGLFQVVILDKSGRNFRTLETHPNIHVIRYNHEQLPAMAESIYNEIMRRDRWLAGRPGNPTTIDRARADRRPPRVLVMVDEYANAAGLLKTQDKTAYGRLTTAMIQTAQEGRAMSVHLALVAQRPDHTQINTTLRGQLDGVTFRMRDANDARLADAPGAENLDAGQAILSQPGGYTTAAMFRPTDGELRQLLATDQPQDMGAPTWLRGYEETADPLRNTPDQAAAGRALPAETAVSATVTLDQDPVTRPVTPVTEAVTAAESVTDRAESVTGYNGRSGRDLGSNPGETLAQAEKSGPDAPVTPVTEETASLEARIRELLTDNDPAPIDGLTVGEARAVTLCLMNGESLSGTCRLVWGGKNGRYMDAVKTVRAALAGTLGAGE
jgi:hypothetical protein